MVVGAQSIFATLPPQMQRKQQQPPIHDVDGISEYGHIWQRWWQRPITSSDWVVMVCCMNPNRTSTTRYSKNRPIQRRFQHPKHGWNNDDGAEDEKDDVDYDNKCKKVETCVEQRVTWARSARLPARVWGERKEKELYNDEGCNRRSEIILVVLVGVAFGISDKRSPAVSTSNWKEEAWREGPWSLKQWLESIHCDRDYDVYVMMTAVDDVRLCFVPFWHSYNHQLWP